MALRERIPDTVPDDVELFEEDGVVYGRDEHGEFKLDPMRGMDEPQDGRCNAVLKYTQERYGETRYCGQLPAENFPGYESKYCKLHKSMEALDEKAAEIFQHGYFAESYINVAKHLTPTKFLFAVEMVGGLFEMSRYDFEIEEEPVALDTSESDLIADDEVELSLPVPTTDIYQFQANELWMAALDEVRVRLMQDTILDQGVSTSHVVATADDEGVITDRIEEGSEHHLNLPISRLTKDLKEHLKNGGIQIDAEDDGGLITFESNDYTLDLGPDQETESDGAQSVSEVGESFTEQLDAEDESAVIEVEEP